MGISTFELSMAFSIPALFLITTGCRVALWIAQTEKVKLGPIKDCGHFFFGMKRALFNLHKITINTPKSSFKTTLFI